MTRKTLGVGALALVFAFETTARAETEDIAASDMPKPPAKKALGEAGDIVLEDVIGARSQSPNTVIVPANNGSSGAIGGATGAASGLGAVGVLSQGPSVSAAWFSMSSSSSGPNEGLSVRISRWSFTPSADVFIARGLSVGGLLGYSRTSVHLPGQLASFDTNAFTIDPRIGYTIPVSSQIVVWPRVHAGITAHYGALDKPTAQQYRAGLDVPLAIRVSSHLLVDVGPEVTYSVLEAQFGSTRTFAFAGRGGLSLVF